MRYPSPVFAALIGLTALVAVPPSVSHAQAAKVATVKPAQVFQKMAETQDLKAKMEGEAAPLNAVGKEKQAKLERLKQERSQLRPDSAGYAEKTRELRAAQSEAKAWQETTTADLDATEKARTLALFKKIETAVAEVAKAKGIDLVVANMVDELPPNVEDISKQQFTTILSQKNVWYTTEGTDITNDVIAKLDADYKSAPK
jgi:Skp family chaperone for outer membrane proteins